MAIKQMGVIICTLIATKPLTKLSALKPQWDKQLIIFASLEYHRMNLDGCFCFCRWRRRAWCRSLLLGNLGNHRLSRGLSRVKMKYIDIVLHTIVGLFSGAKKTTTETRQRAEFCHFLFIWNLSSVLTCLPNLVSFGASSGCQILAETGGRTVLKRNIAISIEVFAWLAGLSLGLSA